MSAKVARKYALPLLVLLLSASAVGADGFLGLFGKREEGRSADLAARGAARTRGSAGKAGRASTEPSALRANLGLVQMAGHFLFEYLKDYKFYIKLLTGYKLDEELTVWALSITCNILCKFTIIPQVTYFADL